MNRLLPLCALVALMSACADRSPTAELEDALRAPALGVRVDVSKASTLAKENGTFAPAATVARLHRRLGDATASLVFSRGQRPLVTLVPPAGPASFATWGPGAAAG